MAKTDFEALWQDAARRYTETAGQPLQNMHMPRTVEDLMKDIKEQNTSFKHFREKQVYI